MNKILVPILLTFVWGVSDADTQDYVKGNVILIKDNTAYFDLGEKDGVAAGERFEIYYDQRVVVDGLIGWADQNISRSQPLDSLRAAEISVYSPMTVKIRLYVAQANRGGFLNIAYFSDLNLDPSTIYTPEDMMVARLIHRGLITRDGVGHYRPDLCGDYEIRDLTYTFYISPEARFHTGRPVEAADVAYSIEQLAQSPRLTTFTSFVLEIQGAEEFRDHSANEISGLFYIDKNTISITLKRPFPVFEDYLAGPGGYIIPRPGYVSTGSNVMGAGYYKMKWLGPDGVVLEPFDETGSFAFFDSLHFIRYANTEEAGLSFELGRLDMINLLGEPPPKFVTRGNFSSQNRITRTYVILGINNARPYQQDQAFGKALSFLLDRGAIVRVLLGGSGAAPTFEPPGTQSVSISLSSPCLQDSADYYLSMTRQKPKIVNLYVDSTYAILGKVSRFIAGQLQNRGIKVNEKLADLRTLTEVNAGSDMDLYLTFLLPVSSSPDCIFYPALSRDLIGQTNFLDYSDEAIETFLDDLHAQTDTDRRDNLAYGLAGLLASDPPLLFLYQPYLTTISKTDISGMVADPSGFVDLRRAFIEMEK